MCNLLVKMLLLVNLEAEMEEMEEMEGVMAEGKGMEPAQQGLRYRCWRT